MIFYISVLLAAFFGGIIRGLVGFLKHQYAYKNVPFKPTYFIGMAFISGMIGLMAAMAMRSMGFTFEGMFTPALSFVIGYAGGDFLDNIYKIISKKFLE